MGANQGANEDFDGKTTHFYWFLHINNKESKMSKTSHSEGQRQSEAGYFYNFIGAVKIHLYNLLTVHCRFAENTMWIDPEVFQQPQVQLLAPFPFVNDPKTILELVVL